MNPVTVAEMLEALEWAEGEARENAKHWRPDTRVPKEDRGPDYKVIARKIKAARLYIAKESR